MENLEILFSQVQETYSENEVTALCLGLLELSGKTLVNGYKIITQASYTPFIPDIVIRVLKNNNPVIVIECKGGNGNAQSHYRNSLGQITNYVRELKFPYGLLVFPNKVIFLTNENDIKIKTEWDVEREDLEDIVNTIKSL